MLVGVTAEGLIDRILDVGQADVIRLVQKSLVLRGVVTELRPAIPVPDRANTVAGSAEAMTFANDAICAKDSSIATSSSQS